jgi:TolB-like protein/DNA-binding winged helix-turn-helix (wHTH) protein/Tfp pilus assembly protein PilF
MQSTPSIMDHTAKTSRFVRFGLFEVDFLTSELRKQGRKVKLQEQQCRILGVLVERPGEVVTREELRKRLWSEDTFVDFDHSLNTAIMRLREALGESSDNPRFIETLPKIGYRFIAPVLEVSEAEHAPQAATQLSAQSISEASSVSAVPHPQRESKPARGKWLVVGGATVGLAVILFISWRYVRPAVFPSSAQERLKSLVVLPLENLSGDTEQEYFADGMTDELIARLAQIRSLRVISRTSAMEYKRTHKPLSEIARDLNVDAIVEGTVLRSGDRVRITAELIQVSTDRHLWAETYESEIGDVLGLQSRVATAIANEIKIKLTPEEQKLLANTTPVSAESYENYLKGRYYWNKRSEESLRKAIDYFEVATHKDPQFALGFAGLADCYSILGSAIVGTVPASEVAPKAKAAAQRALELNTSLAEAQTSLATVNFNYDWDWDSAEKGFKRAIELNPNYATAHQRYSLYFMAMGRAPESIAELDQARKLDPLSISVNFSYGWRLYMARQYEPAIQQLKNTLEMDPNFPLPRMVLGQAYEQEGKYADAIAELERAVAQSNQSPPFVAALGHAYAISGRKADAEKILRQLQRDQHRKYVSPFYVALIYAGLHQNETAVEWLEKAYSDRSNALIFLKVDPELDGLRSNQRFQDIVRKLALPQ